MKKICAWCQKDQGEIESADNSQPVTHGICPDCSREVLSFKAKSMSVFLDKFPGPVYMLNSELEIVSANKEGAKSLGKELAEFSGEVVGKAFECKFSYMEGGCGNTIHCRSCAMRHSIINTYETGKSNLRIPAYPDFHAVTDETEVKYFISTEKVGDAVVVKVEDAI
jgi:hypothetical protein